MKTTRSYCGGTRIYFDTKACTRSKGFAQVVTGQDCSYFGTWANPETLKIVTFCEGDLTEQVADSKEEFASEIREIKTWSKENGYSFTIDAGMNEKIESAFKALGLAELLC